MVGVRISFTYFFELCETKKVQRKREKAIKHEFLFDCMLNARLDTNDLMAMSFAAASCLAVLGFKNGDEVA